MSKRYKLWDIEGQRSHFKNEKFPQFVDFIKRTLDFLAIREDHVLFQNANGFYNMILKQLYLVSTAYQKDALRSHISFIKNPKGGRVDALVPSKIKLLKNVSGSVLSNVIEFMTASSDSLVRSSTSASLSSFITKRIHSTSK